MRRVATAARAGDIATAKLITDAYGVSYHYPWGYDENGFPV